MIIYVYTYDTNAIDFLSQALCLEDIELDESQLLLP